MNCKAGILWRSKSALAAGLLVVTACGCNFSRGKKSEDRKPAEAAQNSSDPSIDHNCIIDNIQNPPEAFHYSYKHNELDEEGDLTPQTWTEPGSTNPARTRFMGCVPIAILGKTDGQI